MTDEQSEIENHKSEIRNGLSRRAFLRLALLTGIAAGAGVGSIDENKIQLVGESMARLQRMYEKPPRLG